MHEFCVNVGRLQSALNGTSLQKLAQWFARLQDEMISFDGKCRLDWSDTFQKHAQPPHSHNNVEDLIASGDNEIFIGFIDREQPVYLKRRQQSRTIQIDINDPIYKQNFLSVLTEFNKNSYTLSVQK